MNKSTISQVKREELLRVNKTMTDAIVELDTALENIIAAYPAILRGGYNKGDYPNRGVALNFGVNVDVRNFLEHATNELERLRAAYDTYNALTDGDDPRHAQLLPGDTSDEYERLN